MKKLEELNEQVLACTRCERRQHCTAPVCGFGDIGAKYMLLGRDPGANEDKEGIPFIGAAGRRLNELLALASISLNDCYLTNVVKCHVQGNKAPRKAYIKACDRWLMQEIELVKPEYIISLGSEALSLFSPTGISQMHGTLFTKDGVKIIPQYHPAAALHQPRLWAVMLNDWENLPEVVPHDYVIRPESQIYPPIIALDTENNPSGGLGVWSVAYRHANSQLCVERFPGARPDKVFDSAVIMHNAKWDMRVMRANGMKVPEKIHDTMIAAYCMGLGRQAPKDSSKTRSGSQMVGGLGLKYLARRHLGMEMKTWQEIKDKPVEELAEYNDADSVSTFLLFEKWKPQLPEHYFKIDMPLLPVLMAMEDRGIAIDSAFLGTFAGSLDKQLGEITLPINAYSPQQIQSYVYGTLDIEPWKFTDSGAPSTDEEVLEKLDDPIIKGVLKYRELHKERGTYAENYVKGSKADGRIRPEFKQTSTATGRLSCAKPNLQNVVKEGDMRKLFVAPHGKKLVRLDWKQLEWAVLAAITQDPLLLKAIQSGKKIHQVVADQLNVPYDKAKTANFALIYGAGAWKLSQALGIPIDEARKFLADYMAEFPGIKTYQNEMREKARGERKVTNYFGRVRRLDSMYAPDWRVKQEGEREAINTPIQGAAAEVVKLAMIDLHYKHSAPMLLQVHDELIFEVDEKEAKEYAHWLEEYIPTITEINGMRFPVSVGVGDSWKEAS